MKKKTDAPVAIPDATLLEILMNSLPDTIYFKDAQSRFIKVNKEQAKLLGLSRPREAIGKTDKDFFPEEFAKAAREDEKSLLRSNAPMMDKLEKLQSAQGGVRWFSATKAPIHDTQGNPVGIVGVSRDVTQRQEMEEQLTEINSLRELLLDIITHDLKNPASVILGMSQMLAEEDPENPLFQSIFSSSQSLLKVLESTTILSQAAFGEKIPMQTLSLKALIEEVVYGFEQSLTHHDLTVEMEVGEDIMISANPLISEIFKNYLSNAIKYAPHGKFIRIESKRKKSVVIITVKDQGETIPEAFRQSIFARQVQLEGELKKGRGLGLAIVKRIARAHGGQVWVEPNQPCGNAFCLKLQLPNQF